MEVGIEQKKAVRKQNKPIVKVPEALVYEVVDGKPIYYKGYKDVLNKTKTFEEITMESQLQSGLKAEITMLIGLLLKKIGFKPKY